MSSVAPISASPSLPGATDAKPNELRAAFQDAVAGLFYGQMIKALRSGVCKPAYLHGGQAEEMFQTQMDQEVAASLARSHGAGMVEELYQRFLIDHPKGQAKLPSELASLAQVANSAATVESAQAAAWARPLTSVAGNTTGAGVITALNRK